MNKKDQKSQLVIYKDKKGNIEFRADISKETIWASLNQIAALFGRDKSVISKHIKEIYTSGELNRKSTVAKNATVQKEGGRTITRDIDYYNLDAVLSIGYRVNSKQATAFRKWATKVLREYVTEGFTINRQKIGSNYAHFLSVVEDIKKLLPLRLRLIQVML